MTKALVTYHRAVRAGYFRLRRRPGSFTLRG